MINNGLHEMYNDCERGDFFTKIVSWINETRHIGKTDRRN